MTALKVLGIILLIIFLFAEMRVGVIVRFDDQTTLKLCIGFVRLTILPKKEKKEEKKKHTETDTASGKFTLPKDADELTLGEIYDLVCAVFSGFRAMAYRAGKRLHIDPLELSVVIGGDDPVEVSQRFGMASAAVWSLMPRLEKELDISDPVIHLDVDYNAPDTVLSGTVGLSFRVANMFEFAVVVAIPLVKWYWAYRRARTNGRRESEAAREATEQMEQEPPAKPAGEGNEGASAPD